MLRTLRSTPVTSNACERACAMKLVTRRDAMRILGAAGLGALSGACSGGDDGAKADNPDDDGSQPDDMDMSPVGGDGDGDLPGDGDGDGDGDGAGDGGGPVPTPEQLLSTIDTIVVLMMENRSFDHFFGALKSDAAYAQRDVVDGLRGDESNLNAAGQPVTVFKMDNFTPEDPPHSWDECHRQWNGGANDGFVTEHAGASENEAMGYHDRSQIPFYYWLADNYTVCDRWFCSLLGPTWPNRYYLHAASSGGRKDNTPGGGPAANIWQRLEDQNQTFKNYYDGAVAWYFGGFIGQLFTLNPTAGIAQFFSDAQAGTLPAFSIIDPDFQANDDHPSHDIMRGQAFVASVYKALAESPQWERCLFVITYDEHGGFYDHVPPPAAEDDLPEFAQLGFRVPAIVVGPTVKRGHVNSTVLEHSSVPATLGTRFGIASLGKRMDSSNDLSSCIDPALYQNPAPPAADPPAVMMNIHRALEVGVGQSSQPELDKLVASGAIPDHLVDKRTPEERIRAWLAHGQRLGAVKLTGG
jgi:phospholipase C